MEGGRSVQNKTKNERVIPCVLSIRISILLDAVRATPFFICAHTHTHTLSRPRGASLNPQIF